MRETPVQQDPKSLSRQDEIDILGYLAIIRKRALLITIFSITGFALSIAYSYSLGDRYKAKAVISPVKEGGASAGFSVLVQQIESVPGMSLSSPSSSGEILALLNSNMLRKKAIEQFNLLPVIFTAKWDWEKNDWAAGKKKPSVHDGLRALERSISVKHSPKDNTITITSESASPENAAAVIEKLLQVLNTHLSSDARRVAESNRSYLEGQLKYTADPLIRQNIYGLIAQQIESSMMAGVVENFAFKVIDPPEAPDMKSSPKSHIILGAGFAISLSAGVFIAFCLEFFEARRGRRNFLENLKTSCPDTERE